MQKEKLQRKFDLNIRIYLKDIIFNWGTDTPNIVFENGLSTLIPIALTLTKIVAWAKVISHFCRKGKWVLGDSEIGQ